MIAWLLAASAAAHVPVVYLATPDDDWCAVVAGAWTGDVVLLTPGEYDGPCALDPVVDPDLPGEALVVQPFDSDDPPVLRLGEGDAAVTLAGGRVTLSGLRFAAVPAGAAAVRLAGGEAHRLRGVAFEIEGVAVDTVGAVGEVWIGDTEVRGAEAGFVLGCPDGGCPIGHLEVYDALLLDVGVGVRVHPGAAGTVRDTVVRGGEAVAYDGGPGAVEENLLVGGGAALRVGGADVRVRNNALIGALVAAGAPGWGPVQVVGNTVVGPVELAGWRGGFAFEDNAVAGALPPTGEAARGGNVACPDPAVCWVDADGWDLYPAPGSPLRTEGVAPSDDPLLGDWCARARGNPPTVGAFEAVGDRSFGPLQAVFKRDFACTIPDEPTPAPDPVDDTAAPEVFGTPTVGEGGCACAAGAGRSGWLAIALLVVARRAWRR